MSEINKNSSMITMSVYFLKPQIGMILIVKAPQSHCVTCSRLHSWWVAQEPWWLLATLACHTSVYEDGLNLCWALGLHVHLLKTIPMCCPEILIPGLGGSALLNYTLKQSSEAEENKWRMEFIWKLSSVKLLVSVKSRGGRMRSTFSHCLS
jgi:hypothetical protein